jgi:hypothetical protein
MNRCPPAADCAMSAIAVDRALSLFTPKPIYPGSGVTQDSSGRSDDADRRQYPRVRAPIYCRPARRRLPRRQVVDVGLGGMRVYSDEPFQIGARFEIELFLPDGGSVTCLTEVVWIRSLSTQQPAKYDVGLQFLDVPDRARERLGEVLENPSDAVAAAGDEAIPSDEDDPSPSDESA